MADSELDAFLGGGGETAPAGDPPREVPPPAPPEHDEPEEPDEGDGGEPDAPEPTRQDGRTVPLSALEAERAQRRDWKAQAVRAETERDELRRQLEEAKRAPPPQQYQPPQPIDPVQQPEQFVERIQQVVLNERLNSSEMMLRREIGAEAVEAAIADFKQAAQSDPTLFPKLYQQPDPYGWLAKHVEVLRMQREIGDDPAAYRAKLRAEIEAELNAAPEAPRVSPAARLAPSLANARSAAPRANGAWAGPTPLEDIFRR